MTSVAASECAAHLTPFEWAGLWNDWFLLFVSADVSDNTEWGRYAVPYIDRMLRSIRTAESSGEWKLEETKPMQAQPNAATQAALVYELELPMPPTANKYWRARRNSYVPYVSEEAQAYKQEVRVMALEKGIGAPLAGDLRVELHFHFTQKNADLDNRLKVTFDALNEVTWNDDVQIVEIHAFRHNVPPKAKKRKNQPPPAPRVGKVIVRVSQVIAAA